MELTNEFTVGVPAEQAWAVLTDVERIAPCMPGAQLQEVEGDDYRGIVKVKVGPITAQYKGTATFVERDEAGRRAVLRAEGRDTRGQGNASAMITATIEPDGGGSKVTVVTDLTVTGKVAQFGRGVLADVSAKLLTQFVQCLESDVLAAPAAPAPASAPEPERLPSSGPAPWPTREAEGAAAAEVVAPATTGPRRIEHKEAAPVDLLGTAGTPIAKRIGPIVGVVVVVLWLLRRRRRKRR